MRVDLAQWKVSVHRPKLARQARFELIEDVVELGAVRTFVVAVLHQCHCSTRWPFDVIALTHGNHQSAATARRVHEAARLGGRFSKALMIPSAPGLIAIGAR